MTAQQAMFVAMVLLGVGLGLMLPRGKSRGRMAGATLALAGIGLFAGQLPTFGPWSAQMMFYVLAAITVGSAIGAVTLRSPVYCALWFALSILGTAGLFLFQGAQFIGIATVVVYAGAIVVTFLFVLMLAQPEGDAPYDRVSREAFLSAGVGALMVGLLTLTISQGLTRPVAAERRNEANLASAPIGELRTNDHVAVLGGRLFGEHLVAIQVIGLLLMVALVAAAAMAAHRDALPAELADRGDGTTAIIPTERDGYAHDASTLDDGGSRDDA